MGVRRLAGALVASLVLLVLAVGLGVSRPPAARAGYGFLADGFAQWDWARATSADRHQVLDAVARPDGWLIVSTGDGYDGWLHLVPPWGGLIDEHNRFGTEPLAFRQLELLDGRLYGLAHEGEPELRSAARLYELDPATGKVLRQLGLWWNQDLAVDPRNGELVLQTWQDTEPYPHHLVSFDPDTGVSTTLVHDTDPKSDDPLEVAYNPEGTLLMTGHPTGTDLDIRRRDGTLVHRLTTGGPIDDLVHGSDGTCFQGFAIYTRVDGTVWGISPRESSRPFSLAGAGKPAAVSFAALDHRGLVLVPRLTEVTLLACTGFRPPEPPSATPPTLPVETEVQLAAAARPAGPGARPVAAAGAPTPQPPQPPLAGPAPPAAIGTQQALSQAIAPQAGLADARDEEPVLGLSASSRLGLGAVATLAMALLTFVAVTPRSDSKLATSTQRGIRR